MSTQRTSRTTSWRTEFIARNGARCHYCNRTGSLFEGPGQSPWHIDHMEPIARGGADEEDNLALACKRCNLTKNAWPYKQFVRLARSAFWQPDDSISEGDLDALLAEWDFLGSDNDALRVDLGENGEVSVTGFLLNEPGADVPILEGRDISRGTAVASGCASFLVTAHRLVPHLVAEIREHRASHQTGSETGTSNQPQ